MLHIPILTTGSQVTSPLADTIPNISLCVSEKDFVWWKFEPAEIKVIEEKVFGRRYVWKSQKEPYEMLQELPSICPMYS